MLCLTVLLAVLLALVPRAVAAGRGDPQLETLRHQHFCELLGYLSAIRSHPLALEDRYLIIDVPKTPDYAQCIFFDYDRKIPCEDASGLYDQPALYYAAPYKLAVLSQFGFSL